MEGAKKLIVFFKKVKGWVKWVNVVIDTIDDAIENIKKTFKITDDGAEQENTREK
jgi:uncharacterized Ntn-hydrolase superfamily protein